MSLLSSLSKVSDPRRKEGRRTSIEQIFCVVTLSYLCGYIGYRPVSSFCKSYESLLKSELDLKHPVPSHVTFREVLMRIDQQQLIDAFNEWSSDYVPLSTGDYLSGDGKSLKSTVIDQPTVNQDFQSVVSLFCQSSGLVAQIATYRHKKKSEIEVVKELIKNLNKSGLIIRLDALHTKKNDSALC
jgi:DDE_Tnp_1-associated